MIERLGKIRWVVALLSMIFPTLFGYVQAERCPTMLRGQTCAARECAGCCSMARRPINHLGARLCCAFHCDQPPLDADGGTDIEACFTTTGIELLPQPVSIIDFSPQALRPLHEAIRSFRSYKGLKIFLPDRSDVYIIHSSFLI